MTIKKIYLIEHVRWWPPRYWLALVRWLWAVNGLIGAGIRRKRTFLIREVDLSGYIEPIRIGTRRD